MMPMISNRMSSSMLHDNANTNDHSVCTLGSRSSKCLKLRLKNHHPVQKKPDRHISPITTPKTSIFYRFHMPALAADLAVNYKMQLNCIGCWII